MLKTLKKDDTTTTPYVATKNWNLSNVANTDLVLAENGNPVAVEYVNYFFNSVETGSSCNVAKEHQENDLAEYRDGLKISGLFYPDQDPLNEDGTYKRIVYNQIKTMFYNNYRDPTKMWGLEKIDFDTSEIKKFLSDQIKIFDIPTSIMGENIVKNTIIFTDNSIDNVYSITDDGNCNLFAGTNLFSRQQEIGNFYNEFFSGSDNTCNSYFNSSSILPTIPSGSIVISVISGSAIVSWVTDITNEDYWNLYRSINGVNYSNFVTTSAGILTYTDTTVTSSVTGTTYWYKVQAVNTVGTSSFSNTCSITFTTPVDETLYDMSGSAFLLGAYDTFKSYDDGTSPTDGGVGWAEPWVITRRRVYTIESSDVLAKYSSSFGYVDGSDVSGSDTGYGWNGPWNVINNP